MGLSGVSALQVQPFGGAGNGLLDNLVAYWPGNEASGNLLDAHTNALHLTDNNTVTSGTGKVYATARDYDTSLDEHHSRADEALLSPGDTDFTFAVWVNVANVNADRGIIGKFNDPNREYQLRYDDSDDRFKFIVSSNGLSGGQTEVDADTFGGVSASTWYLVIVHHDAANNEIGIQVNNGTIDTAAHAGGAFDGNESFHIGCVEPGVKEYDGLIGPTAFWQSAAGGGGALSTTKRAALWNGGDGLPYADFTG